MYIHTYIHTYIRTYIHTYIHTYMDQTIIHELAFYIHAYIASSHVLHTCSSVHHACCYLRKYVYSTSYSCLPACLPACCLPACLPQCQSSLNAYPVHPCLPAICVLCAYCFLIMGQFQWLYSQYLTWLNLIIDSVYFLPQGIKLKKQPIVFILWMKWKKYLLHVDEVFIIEVMHVLLQAKLLTNYFNTEVIYLLSL
jgi:hypothetical protein